MTKDVSHGPPSLAWSVKSLDHVGIAVENLDEAVGLFIDLLGGEFITGGDNEKVGIRLVHMSFPGFKVELLQPLREDSDVARSIRLHGTGFHHLTFLVDDIPTTVSALQLRGFRPTGTDVSSLNWSETFLRPRDSFGALLQFAASPLPWHVRENAFNVRDVLEGKVVWRDYVPELRPANSQRGGAIGKRMDVGPPNASIND